MTNDEINAMVSAILAEFPPEEIPVLIGYLRVRLGWGGSARVIRADGTTGVLDQTFELERYPEALQRHIRDAADRLEPVLRELDNAAADEAPA
jgi:hypothetical protein